MCAYCMKIRISAATCNSRREYPDGTVSSDSAAVFGRRRSWLYGLPQIAVFSNSIAVATDVDDMTVVHEPVVPVI